MNRAIEEYRQRVVEGPLIPTLLRLGVPPLLSQLVGVAYNVLNSLWLSWYSEVAVAVPRQVRSVEFLFSALTSVLSTAGTAVISQLVGAGRFAEVRREVSRLFTASLGVGIAAACAYFSLRPLIFKHVVATPPEIYGDVMGYTAVSALNVALATVTASLTTALSAIGETRLPSLVNLLGMLLNTALDPIFVLGIGPVPRLGPVGSALTDTIGLLTSLSLLLYLFNSRFRELRPRLTADFDAPWAWLVLRIGGPAGLTTALNSTAFMLQQRLVNEFGVGVATAYSIGFVVIDLANAALWGLTGSISIIVGQLIGAGELRRAKASALKGSLFISSIVALSSAAMYEVREPIVRAFASSPAVVAEAVRFLDTILLGLPFFALFMCGFSAARGAGRTVDATVLSFIRIWVLRLGLSYLLALPMGWGPLGIWVGMMVSNVAGGLIMAGWLLLADWARPAIGDPARGPQER